MPDTFLFFLLIKKKEFSPFSFEEWTDTCLGIFFVQ